MCWVVTDIILCNSYTPGNKMPILAPAICRDKTKAQNGQMASIQLHQERSSDLTLLLYIRHCHSKVLCPENSKAWRLSDSSEKGVSHWIQMNHLGRRNSHSQSNWEAKPFMTASMPNKNPLSGEQSFLRPSCSWACCLQTLKKPIPNLLEIRPNSTEQRVPWMLNPPPYNLAVRKTRCQSS